MSNARRTPPAGAVRSLQQTMRRLGFTDASIETYLRVLLHGRRSSTQLRNDGNLSDAELHGASGELVKAGLVVHERTSNKTYWYCTDPALAWLSLAAEVTWSAAVNLGPVDSMPATGFPEVDGKSALLRSAVRPSIQLWAGDRPKTGPSRSAHSSEVLAQLAVEAVQLARVRIRSISVSPKVSSAAKFWPALVAQMNAGVAYTRLTDLAELYEHGLEIIDRDLAMGVDLRFGQQDELAVARGYLADRRVLVRYDLAAPEERPTSGFMTSDRNAIERFVRRFERLAAGCVPAAEALTHLRTVSDGLTERAGELSEDAAAWFDEMIRVGKFANLPTVRRWSDQHISNLERELQAAGLAVRASGDVLLPAWPEARATMAILLSRR